MRIDNRGDGVGRIVKSVNELKSEREAQGRQQGKCSCKWYGLTEDMQKENPPIRLKKNLALPIYKAGVTDG